MKTTLPCSCGQPAVMEKAGQTVCARCATYLKGREFPLRGGKEMTVNESERCGWRRNTRYSKGVTISLFFWFLGAVVTPIANAGPKDWLKHHWRPIVEGSVLVGTSILESKASNYCRRGDIEHCFGGYGGPNAPLAINASIGLGMFAAAQECHKNLNNWWLCYGLGFGVPAFQTTISIQDYRNYTTERHIFIPPPKPIF